MTGQVLRTCGVRIDPLSMETAVDAVCATAVARCPLATHLVNAYTLSLAVRDERFRVLLDRGDLNLPDGMPLVWLGRRAGLSELRARVYGPELMEAVIDRGRATGTRHYLYGSTPAVVERLAEVLRGRFPDVAIVGVEAPPFRPLTPDEEAEVVERVRRSGAQVVWVGLGTPKQDVFVDRFRDRLRVPLVAVGAAFELLSGSKRMAPRWMQDRGLEWLYRLASEPRRLWRRYLVGNTLFLWGAARGTRVEPGPPRPWARGGSSESHRGPCQAGSVASSRRGEQPRDAERTVGGHDVRRPLDVGVGGLLALAAIPVVVVLAAIGAVVFRTNPFFVQTRIGRDGRPFRFLKLRSLPPDTPAYVDKYALREIEVPRFGRFLRAFHLDELPQLFHVPFGPMSLVGPRPEMPFLHERMPDDFARARVSVRPGCTGLWQISVDAHRLIVEAPQYDGFYLARRSLRLDLWILWRSVLRMLHAGRSVTLADVPRWARRRQPVLGFESWAVEDAA